MLLLTSLLFFLAGAFFPISALIKSIFLYPALALSLFQLDYSACLKVYKQSRFLSASLFLFLLLLFSLFYTVADSHRALSVLLKYRRLLYPLVLLPIFYYFPKLRTYLLKGLCASCWIIVLLIIVYKLDALPIKLKAHISTHRRVPYEAMTPAFLFVNPIYGSFIVSLIAYFALHACLLKPLLKQSWFYLSSSLLAGVIILFYQKQNTGFLNYYFLLALLLFQVCISFTSKKRILYLLIIGLPLIYTLTYKPISKFITRRLEHISCKITPSKQNQNSNPIIPENPIISKEASLSNPIIPENPIISKEASLSNPIIPENPIISKEASLSNPIIPENPIISKEASLSDPIIPENPIISKEASLSDPIIPENPIIKQKAHTTTENNDSVPAAMLEFQSFFKEITDYFKSGNVNTDQGVRFQLIKTGFQLWAEKPILGWGVGGYSEAYSLKKWIYPVSFKTGVAANPHNAFILILVELGFIGIIAFFYWLYSILHDNFYLFRTSLNCYPACALIGSIIIGGFADVILFLNITGDFIIIMICWTLTARPDFSITKNKKRIKYRTT